MRLQQGSVPNDSISLSSLVHTRNLREFIGQEPGGGGDDSVGAGGGGGDSVGAGSGIGACENGDSDGDGFSDVGACDNGDNNDGGDSDDDDGVGAGGRDNGDGDCGNDDDGRDSGIGACSGGNGVGVGGRVAEELSVAQKRRIRERRTVMVVFRAIFRKIQNLVVS